MAYTIRDFDHLHARLGDDSRSAKRELAWNECSDCRTGKTYVTVADALDHVNSRHIKVAGEASDPVSLPFEHPNFCWTTSPHEASELELRDWEGLTAIREFILMLDPMAHLCEELSYYVARPHSPSGKDVSPPPFLPAALTLAFCSILASYLYLAKCLLLINRAGFRGDAGREDATRNSIDKARHSMVTSLEQASDLLEKSRLDIFILCSTRREVDCLRIYSVDMQLLTIAFLQEIQSFSLPAHGGQDILQEYRRYLAVLRGRASRRPQRRVFLDIQGFQEELDALKSLTNTQRTVGDKLLNLFYPGSFRVTTETRVGRYEAEHELWASVDKILDDRWEELDRLTQQSRRLKDDVKQAIEILEEDHGKAIRVFTVVTLFFLPL